MKFLIFVLLLIVGGCSTTNNAFFVEGADFDDQTAHARYRIFPDLVASDREFVITGHRIAPGMGTIVGYREFSSGLPLIADAASFLKFTIHIPSTVEKFAVGFSSDQATIYWSRGATSFIGKSGCFGHASNVIVTIVKRTDFELELRVVARGPSTSPAGWVNDCDQFNLDEKIVAKRKLFSDLEPWDGIRSTNEISEAIP